MPDATQGEAVHRLLKRLPQWLRSDLASSDPLLRERAEEALFAMTIACLGTVDSRQAGEVS
ncbi:hypothetical protein SAMN05518866_13638 [Sphingobium sp. YR768]|nr:hypothetical protein [Sphingobium sp. YR768]SES07207.1 hypothetical protein SAMN05518866_13638 [Sphingobium sp. YR768]